MNDLLQTIEIEKIIAIIRDVPEKYIVSVAQALIKGGICMMEITFDQSSESGVQNTLRAMDQLQEQMNGKILMGAGTVLTVEQVQMAYDHGAGYIISPNVSPEVIKKTKELGMISMPGAFTPSEAVDAYHAGADIVKLFPAGVLGADYIAAVRAPLKHIPVAAVGGIDVENIADFFRAGVCCVGIGSNLVSKKKAVYGEFDRITEVAQKLRDNCCSQ